MLQWRCAGALAIRSGDDDDHISTVDRHTDLEECVCDHGSTLLKATSEDAALLLQTFPSHEQLSVKNMSPTM